jgi:hypothetical protein
MDAKRDYARMLTEGYEAIASTDPIGRLEYLADYLFDFTTYESEYSELFAKKALEVCAAISDSKTFEYIKEPENRLWYLLMVNMPFFADKLEWGTSIRGAWWGEPPHKKIEFSSCGLWLDGEQLHETMEFSREQWREFITAVVAFGVEKPNVGANLPDRARKEL